MNFPLSPTTSNWTEAELGDLVAFASGGTPNRETEAFWGGELPWVTARDLKVFELSHANQSLSALGAGYAKIAPPNALLVLVRGMTLFKDFPVAILTREMSFNQDIKALVAKDEIDPHFLGQQLMAKKQWVMRLVDSAGHGTGRLDTDQLKSLPIRFPSLPEQKKIAAFLGVVDAKIAALRARVAGLERYKRGLMQALFSQTLRFTKPDGSAFPDWEEKRANELFASTSNKNHTGDLPILAITQEGGAVLREDIDIDIKATAASVLSYKIVEPGDFIISLRSFQGGIEYSRVLGICSPAYTVLKPIHPISDGFFQSYLKDADFVSRLSATVVGIRDGKQISYSAFSTLILPYPHPDEQAKIAEALSAMDAKIAAVTAQLDQMQGFKKGLLQQMFV